jgi:DNA modification methylase
VACARLGIDFIGIELDEEYLKEAIVRAESAGQQLPLGDETLQTASE